MWEICPLEYYWMFILTDFSLFIQLEILHYFAIMHHNKHNHVSKFRCETFGMVMHRR